MENHLKTARLLTKALESQFQIGPYKFGLDPIIGLIPAGGDLITTALSFYIVWIGIQMRLPGDKIVIMVGNVVVDFLIGLIPVFGDITDFVFKSNTRNLKIIEDFAPEGIKDAELV